MSKSPKRTIARSLGAFVGHIARAITADTESSKRTTVRKTVSEETRDGVVLRRTTIDEVELRGEPPPEAFGRDSEPEPDHEPDPPTSSR